VSKPKGRGGSAVDDTLPLGPRPAVPTAAEAPSHERYERTEKLGEGGMSWVFAARDRELDRVVAFKELRNPSPTAVERFLREARITARLQHPGIVPLYDVGRFPDGTPFYTMRQVSGQTLDDAIAARPTLAERLTLLPVIIAVGEAIAYAHSRRVVHRDLKPLNVLVGAFGETLVIDWGIAKELDAPADDVAAEPRPRKADRTAVGAVMGTPAYMPPEQAEGREIDERADVYALGAMLYALLAGTPPYDGPTWTGVLSQVKRGSPPPLTALAPDAPRALESIAVRAMDRDPARRYPDAAALTEELKRFQAGQLVAAHDYTVGELIVRWLKRNRKLVALGALSLVGFVVLGAFAVKNVTNERNEADSQRARAVAEASRAEQARVQAEARRDELLLAQARALVDEDPTKAMITLRQLPESAAGWREAQDVAVDALSAGVTIETLADHSGPVTALAMAPDGKTLASVGEDGTLRLWDVASGTARTRQVGPDEVTSVAYAPDGRQLATGSADGTVRVWFPSDVEGRVLGRHEGRVVAVVFHPTRGELLSAGDDGVVRGWDLAGTASREILRTGSPDDEMSLAVTKAGDLVYATEGDSVFWAADGRSEARRIPVSDGEALLRVAVSPNGHLVAAAGIDGSVYLVDVRDGSVVRVGEHVGLVDNVVFSPDGRRLVSSGVDETLRFWDVSSAPLGAMASGQRLRGHPSRITAALFSPDGTLVFSADHGGHIREWRAPPAPLIRAVDHVPGADMPTVAADGDELAVAARDGALLVLPSGHRLPCSPSAGRANRIVAVSLDRGRAVCANALGTLTVYQDDRPQQTARANRPLRETTFASGGEAVVFPDGDSVRVLFPRRGSSGLLSGPTATVTHVALSADGRHAAALADREVWRWDIPGGPGVIVGRHDDVAFRVVFSPDGKTIASRGADGKVRLWGEHAQTLDVGDGGWLAFASDGALVVADGGEEIRVFQVAGGGVRVRPAHGVDHLDFLPGGHTVVYALRAGQVRLWDTDAGSVGGVLVPGVRHVVPAPDGMRFVTSGVDAVARVWRVADIAMVPAGAEALHRWVTTP
jgi:eukaryotic-like serine/threonine-protein kinase